MEKIRLDPPGTGTCIVQLTLRKDLRIYHTQLLVESGLEDLNFSFVPQCSDTFRPPESMLHTLETDGAARTDSLLLLFYRCQTLLSLVSKI